MKRNERRADPYRNSEVIDERAPRVNQAVVGAVALLGVVTGWWWLYALLALQLALGLTLGRRWCLACVAYFELIQPRLGEGRLEDARPPRFANMVGLGVLGAATLASLAGLDLLGAALGALRRGACPARRGDGVLRGLHRLQGRLPPDGPQVRLLPSAARPGLGDVGRRRGAATGHPARRLHDGDDRRERRSGHDDRV